MLWPVSFENKKGQSHLVTLTETLYVAFLFVVHGQKQVYGKRLMK